MLGRKRRQQQQRLHTRGTDETQSIHGAASLIGGSGVSLDGQSLILPDDSRYADGDELSSIATTDYGAGRQSFGGAIVGIAAVEPSVPPIPLEAQTGVRAEEPASETKSGAAGAGDTGGGCSVTPLWFANSPAWLKAVMLLSAALLVAAAALVGVAAAMSNDDSSKNTSAGNVNDTTEPTTAPTMFPTFAPTLMPVPGQTPSPTTLPTVEDSESPTVDPGPSEVVITFYATAGRFQGDSLVELENGLPNLPTDDGNAFMVHLGDWNSPFATSCDADSFTEVNTLYSNSAVPVYFVPGDNEYNDCPSPETALGLWYDNLLGYETQYWPSGPFSVTRQDPDYPENFAFLHENILFVGINLVGGTIHDEDEWSARQAADLAWVDENFQANSSQIDLLVLLAHADPTIQSSEPFYTPFFDSVQNDYAVPTIVIVRNLGIETSGVQSNYNGVDGLTLLIVEGSIWPPMKIELSAAGVFNFDQSSWYANEVTP